IRIASNVWFRGRTRFEFPGDPCSSPSQAAPRSPRNHTANSKAARTGFQAWTYCFRNAFFFEILSPTNSRRSQPAVRTTWPLASVVTKSHSKVPTSPATITFFRISHREIGRRKPAPRDGYFPSRGSSYRGHQVPPTHGTHHH